MPAGPRPLTIRPRREMLRVGVAVFALTSIPVFGALYWFAAAAGTVPRVLAVHLVLAVVCLAVYWRQRTVFSAVTETQLIGRGIFSPLVRVPLDDIRRVVLLPVYAGHSPDTALQWLALSRDGRTLFRMRGQFWHERDLRALAEAVGVDVTVAVDPLSEQEFRTDYPGSAYWFEVKPGLRIALTVVVALIVAIVIAWIMSVVGLPLAIDPLAG